MSLKCFILYHVCLISSSICPLKKQKPSKTFAYKGLNILIVAGAGFYDIKPPIDNQLVRIRIPLKLYRFCTISGQFMVNNNNLFPGNYFFFKKFYQITFLLLLRKQNQNCKRSVFQVIKFCL